MVKQAKAIGSGKFHRAGWIAGVAMAAAALVPAAVHASLIADWNANTLATGALAAGATWTDSVNSVVATAAGAGLTVENAPGAFNGNNYIVFGGANSLGNTPPGTTGEYFSVASNTAAQPINDFSITAVFSTTTTNGAGNFTGNTDWYNANGLVGNEIPGIQNDWGFGLSANSPSVIFGEGNTAQNLDQVKQAPYAYATGSTVIATATRNGTTGAVEIYVNGLPIAQTYYPAGITTMATGARQQEPTIGFLIGAMDNYTPVARLFAGDIAQIQIDNTVVNGTTVYNSLAGTYGLPSVPTPEPTTVALLAAGAIGLLMIKRRKSA